MPQQEGNQVDAEEASVSADRGVGIPISRTLRLFAAAVLGVTLLASIAIIIGYVILEKPQWEPAKFDLVSLVIFCFVGVAVCLLPWEKYRVDVKKIGPFEFRQALSAQARERDSELNEIWKRIGELEKQNQKGDVKRTAPPATVPDELKKLIGEFLAGNSRTAYSPLRIKNLQREKFAQYGIAEIRRALREMVAEGMAETKVSQKGNTLYRIAKE